MGRSPSATMGFATDRGRERSTLAMMSARSMDIWSRMRSVIFFGRATEAQIFVPVIHPLEHAAVGRLIAVIEHISRSGRVVGKGGYLDNLSTQAGSVFNPRMNKRAQRKPMAPPVKLAATRPKQTPCMSPNHSTPTR